MEAAARLQGLSYNVILVEKAPHLGGHLRKWDRLFPDGLKAKEALDALVSGIAGVKCFTDTNVTSVNVLDRSYNVQLSNGISVLADAVLLATGFDLFEASRKQEYGYGIYDHVVTNADLEAYFQHHNDIRVGEPRRIGFVHCVGSRDEKVGCRNCSKVCCATAVKQACEVKAEFPQAQVYCFYMDLRMFGRGYEDMYLTAQKDYNVRFIRGRVSEVAEQADGTLLVKAEDTLSSQPLKLTLDLLVLMSGIRPSVSGSKVGTMLGLQSDADGFFRTRSGLLNLQHSDLSGVFLAGTATGAKTLPDTLHEARSAAMAIHEYLQNL